MDALFNSKIGRELKDYVAITLGIMCYALGVGQPLCFLTKSLPVV